MLAATLMLAAVGAVAVFWTVADRDKEGAAGAPGAPPLSSSSQQQLDPAQEQLDPIQRLRERLQQRGEAEGQAAKAARLMGRTRTGAAGSLRWSMTAPAVLDWTGDGTEDVVGAVKLSSQEWAIAGFDGRDLKLLWQSPPFAAENAQLHLKVVGDKVLVLNKKTQQLRAIEPKTGATLVELALSDKPNRACADPIHAERAWIEVEDQNHQMLDLAKGTAAPADRPSWCPQRQRSAGSIHCGMSQNPTVADCQGTSAAPKVAGAQARLMLVEGNIGVVQAEKSPGTAYARLYGITLDDRQLRWQVTPSDHGDSVPSATRLADLIDGKYAEVVPLQSGDVELVVFDAATGKRLWAKSIATKESYTDSFAGHAFLMSPTRVYAAVGTFASKLRVFDLASGREVGSIGEL
jgi:outer membrane protein assembly factor BamB